jgi:hypothetical protein
MVIGERAAVHAGRNQAGGILGAHSVIYALGEIAFASSDADATCSFIARAHARFTQVDSTTWRIEPSGGMRVPGIIYADEKLIQDMDDKVYDQNTCKVEPHLVEGRLPRSSTQRRRSAFDPLWAELGL